MVSKKRRQKKSRKYRSKRGGDDDPVLTNKSMFRHFTNRCEWPLSPEYQTYNNVARFRDICCKEDQVKNNWLNQQIRPNRRANCVEANQFLGENMPAPEPILGNVIPYGSTYEKEAAEKAKAEAAKRAEAEAKTEAAGVAENPKSLFENFSFFSSSKPEQTEAQKMHEKFPEKYKQETPLLSSLQNPPPSKKSKQKTQQIDTTPTSAVAYNALDNLVVRGQKLGNAKEKSEVMEKGASDFYTSAKALNEDLQNSWWIRRRGGSTKRKRRAHKKQTRRYRKK